MNKHWQTVALGEVLTERQETPLTDDLITGKTAVIAKIGFNDGEIQLRKAGDTKTNMILIKSGDLVFSGINAEKGAIAIYDETNKEPIAATIHYGSYIPNKEKVDIKFLWYFFRSHVFKDLLMQYLPNGIKTEVKAKRLLPIPISLPSLTHPLIHNYWPLSEPAWPS